MISISLTVTTESPLHIGGEEQINTWADKPLVKWRNGEPYVPASTIKGRLRAELEALLRSTTLGPTLCQPPRAENMCQAGRHTPCPVCKLFGSPLQEGELYFGDLYLTAEYDQIPQTAVRTGTRINRRRHIVEDDLLYDIELFMPGEPLVFEGVIRCFAEQEITPLYVAARSVTMLGGGRSRGLGWGRIDIEGAPSPHELDHNWAAWIARLAGSSNG